MEFDPNLVSMLLEFDMPKGNLEGYNKTMAEVARMFVGWQKDGIIKEYHSWSDNCGYILTFVLFDSIDKFAELWNHPKFHSTFSSGTSVVINARWKLLRPAQAPE